MLIVFLMVGRQRKIHICHHRQSGIFGSTSYIFAIILALGRQRLNGFLTIRVDEAVYFFCRRTCYGCRLSRFEGLCADGNTPIKPYEHIVVMCAKEIGLSQAALLDSVNILALQSLDEDIALSDANPWRPPHIKSHTVVAVRGEVGRLNRLQAIRTTTSANNAVARNDVERP